MVQRRLIFWHGVLDTPKIAHDTVVSRFAKNIRAPNSWAIGTYPSRFENMKYYTIASLICLVSIVGVVIFAIFWAIYHRTASHIIWCVLGIVFLFFLSCILAIFPCTFDRKDLEPFFAADIKAHPNDEYIIYGHSFGSSAALQMAVWMVKYHKKNLAAVYITSGFSTLITAAKHFPLPQTQLMNIFGILGLFKGSDTYDFDNEKQVKYLKDHGISAIPANSIYDKVIPPPAQLMPHVPVLIKFSDAHNGLMLKWPPLVSVISKAMSGETPPPPFPFL